MTIHQRVDFIGIGAQKAGTSWLYRRLNELSEFSFTPIKELHYFDRNKKYPSTNELAEGEVTKRLANIQWVSSSARDLGQEFFRGNFRTFRWLWKWYFSNYNDAWYLSLFDHLKGIKGEITPAYSMLDDEDIRAMHALIPNLKVVLILRNPIDRAWSHYRFQLQKTPNASKQKINLHSLVDFMESDALVLRSDYIRTMNKFSNYFSKETFLVCFYDAISDNPQRLLSEIVKFLGGNPDKIQTECNLYQMNNVSIKKDMPLEVREYLKKKYHDQIKELSDVYGGYFTKWYVDSYDIDVPTSNDSQILIPTTHVTKQTFPQMKK